MKQDCEDKLKDLTSKKRVVFVKRGNKAIRSALKLVKKLGFKKVLLQDMGGWMTYPQFCRKEKLEMIDLRTDFGLINPQMLKDYSDCVLLINSMPGYHALQDMKEILKVCKENNIFVINDVSGSVGTDQAMFGNLIFGSFGDAKPINVGNGGFVAFDNPSFSEGFDEETLDYVKLLIKLNNLDKRLNDYQKIRTKILSELKQENIIHKDFKGINVIIRFSSDIEKERLINYCDKNNLEHTLCPRYIRVNVDALSIEVKRL